MGGLPTRIKRVFFIGLVALLLSTIVTLAYSVLRDWGKVVDFLNASYNDTRLVQWVAVAVNLLVVFIALFLNTLLAWLRKPRFRVDFGSESPWQTETTPKDTPGVVLVHFRLRIRNIGRTAESSCEVRVEEVSRLRAGSRRRAEVRVRHDPRPLKWAGRSTQPISLSPGAFDLVDLGVRRSDTPELLRLEFADRGHLDLVLDEDLTFGFRIAGTVYGEQAIPRAFMFDLRWHPHDSQLYLETRKRKR